MNLLQVIPVLYSFNMNNIKTHFYDGQTGRIEYTIQISFVEIEFIK